VTLPASPRGVAPRLPKDKQGGVYGVSISPPCDTKAGQGPCLYGVRVQQGVGDGDMRGRGGGVLPLPWALGLYLFFTASRSLRPPRGILQELHAVSIRPPCGVFVG
jgi:hypothetical protein